MNNQRIHFKRKEESFSNYVINIFFTSHQHFWDRYKKLILLSPFIWLIFLDSCPIVTCSKFLLNVTFGWECTIC